MERTYRSKRPSVSLCMIVKNEDACLAECLQSVCDVVDEIIIVDTGSSDRTLEIARQFDSKLFHFAWNDDFAAARNESLRHASGNWILQLDADERLLPESKAELRQCIESGGATCYSVVIDSPAERLKKGHISRAHRLFQNLPGIQYSGRIHEQISPSVAKIKGSEKATNIKLLHLGYAKNAEAMHEKSQRNFDLLKKQIADEPDNAYWHYTLAQNLILSQNYRDALPELEAALKIGKLPSDIRCGIFNNLAEVYLRLQNYPQAVQYAQKALAVSRSQLTSHLLLHEVYGHLGDTPKQIECLQSAIQLMEKKAINPHEISLDAYVDPAALYLNLGHHYLKQKCWHDAAATYRKALAIDANNVSALRGLADALMEQKQFADAAEILEQLNAKLPDDPMSLEKLAWLAIKFQNFAQAATLYSQLLHQLPDDTNIQRRLAALYYKIGDTQKGKACLLKSRSAAL